MTKITQIGDFIFEGTYSLHSTFNNISNFINEEKNIVSIAQNEKYLIPNSIIISETLHKNIKSVIVRKDEIIISEQSFNKADLRIYNSEVSYAKELDKTILNNIFSFIEDNTSELNPLSLVFLINLKFEDAFETRFKKAFVKHIKLAWNKIKEGNLLGGIQKMKSSEIGLMPSGDDFITRMLGERVSKNESLFI